MQWDARFSIGIDVIDHQHQVLLEHFSQLQQAIEAGGRWSDVHFPLIALREYAHSHFHVEECLMRMSDYPETEAHIESHHKILQQLGSLEHSSLQKNLAAEDACFLRDWLVGHIMKADRDYANHFANGGQIRINDAAKSTCMTI